MDLLYNCFLFPPRRGENHDTKDYQQQGGWSDESGEIGPLCKPITKDGGIPAQAVNNTWVSVSEPKEHQLLVCAALLRHF